MVGQCDAPKFEAAGDHWNPTNAAHGTKNPKGPHLGDLPNLTVGRDSSVTVQATSARGSLRGQNPLLDSDGASVVVHAKADDYRSQPSGNSGDKIACGVVEGG
jgi:Cu-Zn family superoxide dismutase